MRELLEKRCRRAIAIVLTAKEKEADPFLPPEAQARLRKVVMEQFNDLTGLAIDMVESLDGAESVLNEIFVEKINEIHSALVG